MEDLDLLFFCTVCKEKPLDEISKIRCTIPHTSKVFKKGEYIACQGDEMTCLYMLSKGSVRTEVVSESGFALRVEEIKAPYPLAAAFMFADENCFPVDIIALEDVEVIQISKQSVEQQMAKCPHFLRGFMAFSANRMQVLSNRLKMFSMKGIKPKLAFYILQRTKEGSFDLGQSVASLAEYFGVERPSLSRALSEMVREGIIEYEAGKGRILNHHVLKEML